MPHTLLRYCIFHRLYDNNNDTKKFIPTKLSQVPLWVTRIGEKICSAAPAKRVAVLLSTRQTHTVSRCFPLSRVKISSLGKFTLFFESFSSHKGKFTTCKNFPTLLTCLPFFCICYFNFSFYHIVEEQKKHFCNTGETVNELWQRILEKCKF